MASIKKHGSDTLFFIRHNMRELPPDKVPKNIEIDKNRINDNYSIIKRGNTADEINKYRHEISAEIFKYKRKNLVQSVEICITLPQDCPAEQEKDFFKESVNYVASTLPMGEKCIFLAEIHADEGHVQKDGITVVQGEKHLHIMYVPAVKDSKHEGYEYKLSAHELTSLTKLKQFHPRFQKWLDDAGIKATVNSGITGGKNISVDVMKAITKETGLTLDQIKSLQHENVLLQEKISSLEAELSLQKNHTHTAEWGKSHSWESEKIW